MRQYSMQSEQRLLFNWLRMLQCNLKAYICRCVQCCSIHSGCRWPPRAPGQMYPCRKFWDRRSPEQGRCTCNAAQISPQQALHAFTV